MYLVFENGIKIGTRFGIITLGPYECCCVDMYILSGHTQQTGYMIEMHICQAQKAQAC